jgi:hypothetical protein
MWNTKKYTAIHVLKFGSAGMRSEGLELNLWEKTQIRNQLCDFIRNQKGIKLKVNLKLLEIPIFTEFKMQV